MKRSKFTEETDCLRAEAGAEAETSVEEVRRRKGDSDTTLYNNCRNKCGDPGPSELQRQGRLEEETAKLKRMVADLSPTMP